MLIEPMDSVSAFSAEQDLPHLSGIGATFRQVYAALGYCLKLFGSRDRLGDLLFSLIDNAKAVVMDYAQALERRASQVDLRLHDPEIADTPHADRRLYVLDPLAKP